jgi:hypothetical protein
MAQPVCRRLPTAGARVRYQVRTCGICVGQRALWEVFSEYVRFPYQFSFHQLLHTHLASGAGTIGQIVFDVPSGLSLTWPQGIKKGRSICCHMSQDHDINIYCCENLKSQEVSSSCLRSEHEHGYNLRCKEWSVITYLPHMHHRECIFLPCRLRDFLFLGCKKSAHRVNRAQWNFLCQRPTAIGISPLLAHRYHDKR